MRTVTIWESGVRTNAVPSAFPNSPKNSSNGFHTNTTFRLSSKQTSSSPQWRRSSIILRSRPSSKWHTASDKEIHEEHFRNFSHTALEHPRGRECRLLNCKGSQVTVEALYCLDNCDTADALSLKHQSENENHMHLDVPISDTAHFRLLKLVLLVGSLTLQDIQPAVASSDFTSGFQTVNFFGDLGDISTGFASAFLLIFFSELGDKTFFIA
ncbi:hypothetical protein Ancab_032754, partial [Ancistrocladus abbreviatus]